MSTPNNHSDAAKKNAHGDDLLNDVRRQKSAAARRDPQADRFAANARRADAEGWQRTTGSRELGLPLLVVRRGSRRFRFRRWPERFLGRRTFWRVDAIR
jgi:hypothetical protein